LLRRGALLWRQHFYTRAGKRSVIDAVDLCAVGQDEIDDSLPGQLIVAVEVDRDPHADSAGGLPVLIEDEQLKGDKVIVLTLKLIEAGKIPDRMVLVPGGPYGLVSWGKPTRARTQLGDFFIDRFEVSNREYKEFISKRRAY
jgi:formylglycine-generating enzyme required for sulfatase activity